MREPPEGVRLSDYRKLFGARYWYEKAPRASGQKWQLSPAMEGEPIHVPIPEMAAMPNCPSFKVRSPHCGGAPVVAEGQWWNVGAPGNDAIYVISLYRTKSRPYAWDGASFIACDAAAMVASATHDAPYGAAQRGQFLGLLPRDERRVRQLFDEAYGRLLREHGEVTGRWVRLKAARGWAQGGFLKIFGGWAWRRRESVGLWERVTGRRRSTRPPRERPAPRPRPERLP
jgi:hypothetical protein